MGIIYCATFPNGKKYIGQTTGPLNRRMNEHYCCARNNITNSVFHKAINKYGESSVVWSIVEEVPNELLNSKEEYYIRQFDTFYKNGHGYNMNYGGQTGSVVPTFTTEESQILYKEWLELGSVIELSKKYNCDYRIITKAFDKIHPDWRELRTNIGRGHSIKFTEEQLLNLYERYKEIGIVSNVANEFEIDVSTANIYLQKVDKDYKRFQSISCKFTNIEVKDMWETYKKEGCMKSITDKYDVHYATLINLFKKIDKNYSRYKK